MFLRERLGALGWVGVAISFFRVAVMSLGDGDRFGIDLGALLVLTAALSASVYFVVQKPYLTRYGRFAFTAYAVWSGTLFLLPFAPRLADDLARALLDATIAATYLGVVATVAAYAHLRAAARQRARARDARARHRP